MVNHCFWPMELTCGSIYAIVCSVDHVRFMSLDFSNLKSVNEFWFLL